MDDYRTIHALEDHHVPHLMQLYKGAWWSHDRTIEQVRAVLEGSNLNVEHVELYCRPDLVPFYQSLGFASPGSGVVLLRRSAGA